MGRVNRIRTESVNQSQTPVPSAYLMNDIPRGTTRSNLMNSLLTPRHLQHATLMEHRPDVVCGIIITNSRLDDELSVATIEFSDTPRWLQDLNLDPRGFPKSTAFGTIWRAVDRGVTDSDGRNVFINAVINGTNTVNLHFAEMLAEFPDTDVNIQDNQGRTALHWACAENLSDMVRLCLSVPECIIGLKENQGLTAFDLSLGIVGGDDMIPALFYKSMFELEETEPEAAFLRALTVTSVPATDRAIFPGEAIFDPIMHRNEPLVKALVDRGVDLTATTNEGDTALHLATELCDVSITAMLLKAGSDPNALGAGGATPLHRAADNGQLDIALLLLGHGAEVGAKDRRGKTALQHAAENLHEDIVELLGEVGIQRKVGQELSAPEPQIMLQSDSTAGQTGLVSRAENYPADRLSVTFNSELALSSKHPMEMMEWVREVDAALIDIISVTSDRLSIKDDPEFSDATAALNTNAALEPMERYIFKDTQFTAQIFLVGDVFTGGSNIIKVLFYDVWHSYRKLIRGYIS